MDPVVGHFRVCPKCEQDKPVSHFIKGERKCKACRYAVQKAWVQRNWPKKYAVNKRWAQTHPDKMNAYARVRSRRLKEADHDVFNKRYRRDAQKAIENGICLKCGCQLNTKGPLCGGCYRKARPAIIHNMSNSVLRIKDVHKPLDCNETKVM